MSALEKISDSSAKNFNDLGHVMAEIGEAMKKTSSLSMSPGKFENTAHNHLPPCTIGDFAGTVPRACEFTPKKESPKDIPARVPNKFGPSDNPAFD